MNPNAHLHPDSTESLTVRLIGAVIVLIFGYAAVFYFGMVTNADIAMMLNQSNLDNVPFDKLLFALSPVITAVICWHGVRGNELKAYEKAERENPYRP